MSTPTEHVHLNAATERSRDLVGQDCWRTPFSTVSWAYTPCDLSSRQHRDSSRPSILRSSFAKPPHYHYALYAHHIPTLSTDNQGEGLTSALVTQVTTRSEGHGLNPDCLAVRSVAETLKAYEMDVGFYCVPDDSGSASSPERNRCSLGRDIDEDQIMLNVGYWQKLMRSLTGDVLVKHRHCSPAKDPDTSFGLPLSNSHGTQSIDSHSPNRVCTSPPETPHTITLVESASPGSDLLHAAAPLNDSATLLISTSPAPIQSTPSHHHLPFASSRSSTPSPVFTNFTFPTLNSTTRTPSPPRVLLKQDAHGFYHQQSILHPHRPVIMKPSVSPRTSFKMRLMSASGGGTNTGNSPSPAGSPSGSSPASHSADLDFFTHSVPPTSEDGHSPRSSLSPSATSCEDDGDGWIRAAPETRVKSRRSKALCLAMSRHHSPSPCASPWSLVNDGSADASSDDGWIEGPPQLPQRPSLRPLLRKNRNPASNNGPTRPPFTSAHAPHVSGPTACPTVHSAIPYTTPFTLGPPAVAVPPYTHTYTQAPVLPCAGTTTNTYYPMQTYTNAQMQMQFQMQMHAQAQAHCSSGRAEWFPPQSYLVASQPTLIMHAMPPVLPVVGAGPLQPGAPYHVMPTAADPRNITGVSGMRHASRR